MADSTTLPLGHLPTAPRRANFVPPHMKPAQRPTTSGRANYIPGESTPEIQEFYEAKAKIKKQNLRRKKAMEKAENEKALKLRGQELILVEENNILEEKNEMRARLIPMHARILQLENRRNRTPADDTELDRLQTEYRTMYEQIGSDSKDVGGRLPETNPKDLMVPIYKEIWSLSHQEDLSPGDLQRKQQLESQWESIREQFGPECEKIQAQFAKKKPPVE